MEDTNSKNTIEEDANAAALALTQSLDQWTSSKLASPVWQHKMARHGLRMLNNDAENTAILEDEFENDDEDNERMASDNPIDETEYYDTESMDDDGMEEDDDDAITNSTAQTSTPPSSSRWNTERARTPVMSNSSSRSASAMTTTTPHPWTPVAPPPPVETPAPTLQPRSSSSMSLAAAATPSTATTTAGRTAPWRRRRAHTHYRRSHDAVRHFLHHKRAVLEQWTLCMEASHNTEGNQTMLVEHGSRAIAAASANTAWTTTAATRTRDRLVQKETQVDLDFLGQLVLTSREHEASSNEPSTTTSTNSSTSITTKEGNLWSLLHHLRVLGTAPLVWDDDEASRQQHKLTVQSFVQSLAVTAEQSPNNALTTTSILTPRALVARWSECPSDTVPLVVQRRNRIRAWVHAMHDAALPPGATRPRPSAPVTTTSASLLHNSAATHHLHRQGLYATNRDSVLLAASLDLVLAGRLGDAQALVRASGAAWRATAWAGGALDGNAIDGNNRSSGNGNHTSNHTTTMAHNPRQRRALWRRTVHRHAQHQHTNSNAVTDASETAILAILSSNWTVALESPVLRTWERGLAAGVECAWERTVDELLHVQQQKQQSQGQFTFEHPPHRTTGSSSKDLLFLSETRALCDMDEKDLLRQLDQQQQHDDHRRCRDPVTQLTSAFLQGKGAIRDCMEISLDRMDENERYIDDDDEDAATTLRCLTHLAIYLDSFSIGTTPIVIEGVSEWKNQLILAYIRHLAQHEDLWYMVVLYASLLPEPLMMGELPHLLQSCTSSTEREVICKELGEYLTTRDNMDRDVLRKTVALELVATETVGPDNGYGMTAPSNLDVRKMESILWLCIKDEHAGDALLTANALLRQFLLDETKIASATMFLEDVFPTEILDAAMLQYDRMENDDEAPDGQYGQDELIQQAHSEHCAYTSFLAAIKTFEDWQTTIETVRPMPTESIVNPNIDLSKLTEAEVAIAKNMDKRQLVENKQRDSLKVVAAAEKAQKALMSVMKHPGGWLLTDDDDIIFGGAEELLRRQQLQEIRRTILPRAVMLYHGICMKTASWLSDTLDDLAEECGGTMTQFGALCQVDQTYESVEKSYSSLIAPRYWTRKAMELAEITESDEFGIYLAFGTSDYKELLERMSESAIVDQMYGTAAATSML